MPPQIPQKPRPSATKRSKLEHSGKSTRLFTSADEIGAALRAQNQEALVANLTTLRNQLSIRPGEESILPQDARLLLAQSWLERSTGAQDLFEVWDSQPQRQNSVFALIVSILSALVSLTSSHYTFQALGHPIIKSLLMPSYSRRLNSYLGGSHAELILVTLKLFNAMSTFASGREKKAVLEVFGWELKLLPKLLNMRRKSSGGDAVDALEKPDIRTFYILFMLSFVTSGSPAQVKAAFLEQHREPFLAIFKSLIQDSYFVVRRVLEVCWAGIWSDPKLKRTLKLGLFSEATISHIVKLYDRNVSESADPDHVPADLVHHFLLAICTRPGIGICFKDRGWYPRESDSETITEEPIRGKIYNKILSNILKTLKVNEDQRQQELALKIMHACPELVSGYWSAAALTLEPRLASKWIANIAFFGSVISLPVPSSSFYLTNNPNMHQPSPPPLSTIIENILPSVNTKAHFSKGLQSPSGLVQHSTAIALAKCLVKYEEVLRVFQSVESSLEENEIDGQWSKRRRDLEREVRRRVPDFMVIVAFSQQQKLSGVGDVGIDTPGVPAKPPNLTRVALLAESAQRLLWMYHRCLSSLVTEAHFDVGKLLQNFSTDVQVSKDQDETAVDSASRLHVVRQLHVLRLLKDSEQFAWSGKMGSTSQSYFAVLLNAYTTSDIPATRTALFRLLERVLSQSILFQDDISEPYLWLTSLPTIHRARGTESPDGAPLEDECNSIITFLDDCVQRCIKTYHRYLEDLHSFSKADRNPVSPSQPQPNSRVDHDSLPSPLLMTVLEQLEIKVTKNSLSASAVLALACFVRKLVFRLQSKQQDLGFLHGVADRLDAMLDENKLFPEFPIMSAAIRREIEFLRVSFSSQQLPSILEVSDEVQDFLDAVEQLPIPAKKSACISTACELIDWLRLVEENLGPDQIRRVVAVLKKLHPSILSLVAEHVLPIAGSFWVGLDLVSHFAEFRPYLGFDFLFLHASETQIVDERCRDILAELAIGRVRSVVDAKRSVCLLCHRLHGAGDTQTRGLFLLLGSILKRSSDILSSSELAALKDMVFVQSQVIKSYLISTSLSETVREGLHHFVNATLDSSSISDRSLISGTADHWLETLQLNLPNLPFSTPFVLPWIKYFQLGDLFTLLDTVMAHSEGVGLLEDVLTALKGLISLDPDSDEQLLSRLPRLIALHPMLPDSSILEELVAIAVSSSIPAHCDGSQCGDKFEDIGLLTLVKPSVRRWRRRSTSQLANEGVQSFVGQQNWTAFTVSIVSGLIYGKQLPRKDFIAWLGTEHCASRSPEHFVTVFHAFLDSTSSQDETFSTGENDVWIPQFSRVLKAVQDEQLSPASRTMASVCVCHIVRLLPSMTSDLISHIKSSVNTLPLAKLDPYLLPIARRVRTITPTDSVPLLTDLLDHGIQWAVRFFAEPEDASFDTAIDDLTALVPSVPSIKPHLVETLLGVFVQSRLSHLPAARLIIALLSNVHLKPVVVNRHLQSILQHPNFFKLCGSAAPLTRSSIVHVLHVLFHLHPQNTCQVTHVEPLIRIYRGSLEKSDGLILSILRLFETERQVPISSLLCTWSSSANLPSANSLEAVQSLDPILVLRTCLNFPRWRRIEDLSTGKATSHEAQLYDPVFLMLLFAQMIAENPPESAFAWVELFRTNIVSLLIKALSSKDGAIREISLCQITALWQYLENADLQERPHVIHILTLLKDALPSPPPNEPPRRLPSYTTLLLLHALRGIFYSSNFIYPITARFLLQRPELDTKDVPMLYSMLYSSSDDWKKERGWMIRFLSDGMMSSEDWRVLKGRHTWDLLASMFQSPESDRTLRAGIFEVLANLTCNAQATTSLVLKSGLLSWIEIQLMTSKDKNPVEWVKILDNILTIADPNKFETSTDGDWRIVICRCLSLLVDSSTNTTAFPLVVQAALRLSLLSGPQVPQLPVLLTQCLKHLEDIESSTTIPPTSIGILPLRQVCGPFYSAHDVHEPVACDNALQIWGMATEMLWRIAMTLEEPPAAWDAITSRVLVWRALVGADNSVLGEWARGQAVRNIGM